MLFFETIEKNFNNSINSFVFIREDGFIGKDMTTESEKIQAYHLRHRVFCREWLGASEG